MADRRGNDIENRIAITAGSMHESGGNGAIRLLLVLNLLAEAIRPATNVKVRDALFDENPSSCFQLFRKGRARGICGQAATVEAAD